MSKNYKFVSKNKKKNSSLNFLNIDAAISINGINDKLIKEINSIGPYGSGNPRPIFVLKSIKILKPLIVGDSKKHISYGKVQSGDPLPPEGYSLPNYTNVIITV